MDITKYEQLAAKLREQKPVAEVIDQNTSAMIDENKPLPYVDLTWGVTRKTLVQSLIRYVDMTDITIDSPGTDNNNGNEVIGYQVWWGLLKRVPIWPPFETRDEAEAKAATIKSSTEIRPVYSRPQNLQLRIDELEKEAKWVRRKLELPEDTPFLSGGHISGKTLAGQMHNICHYASGYLRYIEAGKCDDKVGEIARQHLRIAELKEKLSAEEEASKILSNSVISLGKKVAELREERNRVMSCSSSLSNAMDELEASVNRITGGSK